MTYWVDRDVDGKIVARWIVRQHAGQERVPSLDVDAARSVDGMDRLQFEHLFQLENEKRDLKAKINLLLPLTYPVAETQQITKAQYRDALIARWKAIHS